MNLEKLIAENMLRFGAKNLSESTISKIKLLIEQTEPKTLEKTITFPSGKHSAAASNISGILDPGMAEIEKFLQDNGASSKIVTIDLQSGESQVPNYDTEVEPKRKLNPGDLSTLRYNTIETYMQEKINQWKKSGLLAADQNVTFNKITPVIGATPWAPPANATVEQIKKLAADAKYTKEQFMRMYIKVTAEQEDIDYAALFSKTITNRESISKTAGGLNTMFFYNYSIPAAAVMNVDYKTLPSQLLTMNKYFANRNEIQVDNIIIPKVTINIQPNGGTQIPLLVLDSRKTLQPWTSNVAESYNLIIPFKENDPKWVGAWLFACLYLKSTYQLDDWSRIANKPSNIDFSPIFKISRTTKASQAPIETPEYQLKYFSNNGEFISYFGEEGETFNQAYNRLVTDEYD
jgi:hypothetical protein